MVKLNKIYTKKGDGGTTSLSDGKTVAKSSKIIDVIGLVDETNSFIGYAKASCNKETSKIADIFSQVQHDLFDIGADLSFPILNKKKSQKKDINQTTCIDSMRISSSYVDFLEEKTDYFNKSLPSLKSFVLPTGSELAARIHLARAVCRRLERKLFDTELDALINNDIRKYINRLSDLLFVTARYANSLAGLEDLWQPHFSRKKQTNIDGNN